MAGSRIIPKRAGPVYLDSASLTQDGAGYRVRLTGSLDATWIRAYMGVWTGLKFFSRFQLDVESRTVWFSLAETESQADIGSVIAILAAMLRLTTHSVGDASGFESRHAPARPRRNRLAPVAELRLPLPPPPPPELDPPRATQQDEIEDLRNEDVDSLVAEDLIEA